jgi:hypothetical protein
MTSTEADQWLDSVALDCDGDTIVLCVTQQGGIACHTGRESCFFRTLDNGQWNITETVLKDPNQIYRKS